MGNGQRGPQRVGHQSLDLASTGDRGRVRGQPFHVGRCWLGAMALASWDGLHLPRPRVPIDCLLYPEASPGAALLLYLQVFTGAEGSFISWALLIKHLKNII